MKKTELLHALRILKIGVSNENSAILEQASHVIFKENKLYTYGDMSVQIPFQTNITGTVPFELFYKFIEKFNKDEFDLSLEEDKIWLLHKRQKAWFPIQDEINFKLIQVKQDVEWKTLPDNFWQNIQFTAPTCSNDPLRPALTCISVTEEGIIYGTDGFRLLECDLGVPVGVNFLFSAQDALKIVPFEPQEFAVTDNWLHFRLNSETIISSRRIKENFPKVDSFFESMCQQKTRMFPSRITEALKILKIFSSSEENTAAINLKFTEKELILSSETYAGGYEESILLQDNDLDLEFSINPYLLEGIISKNLGFILEGNKIYFSGENWKYLAMLKKVL